MSAADDHGPRRCPCGTGLAFDRCCWPLLHGERDAATAEQLMRSRYSAYAVGDDAYLRHSWARAHRPRTVHLDPDLEWTGLTIVATEAGGLADQEGMVTFEARHRRGRHDGVLREVSRFEREDGRWVYVAGQDEA